MTSAKYDKLRDMLHKTLTFEYDSGAKVVGVLKELRPDSGPVQLAVMKDVDILSEGGDILEHHPIFSFVPTRLRKFGLKKE